MTDDRLHRKEAEKDAKLAMALQLAIETHFGGALPAREIESVLVGLAIISAQLLSLQPPSMSARFTSVVLERQAEFRKLPLSDRIIVPN